MSSDNSKGNEWKTVEVPGIQKFESYAWYRTWFLPNRYFFIKHDRDLFRESVSITVRGLAGAHEVYINGNLVSTGGSMPPDYESGRELNLRHKIPPGLVREGLWNEIAFRVYTDEGEGGFTTEAPVIVNYFDECQLAGAWEFHSGDVKFQSRGALVEKPSTSSFDQFNPATTALGEAPSFIHGPKLPPAESATRFTTAEDLVIEQILHEPLIAQPNHFSFDERGRLWVAQYRQYPYPAGVKVLSRDRYYRSVFDKVPPAPPNHDPGRDVISIHEDTDSDGVYDKHKIFVDCLNMATSALPGHDGVWIMNPPYLLHYPDADRDDRPDGDPVVHLEGFGLQDTHAVANGLTWGPDGWIYGAQGSSTSSHIIRPGIDNKEKGVYFEGPMVWRYHPVERVYEIFAEGGGNVFGIEFDAQGRLFSGTNGDNTRGWHYVQGGTCGVEAANRGKYGPSPHPYNFGELAKMPSEQPIRRFSHIAAVVEGTALPDQYAGHFFSIDPLHSNVIDSVRIPLGSSFQTSDLGDVVNSADQAFRPVYIANAPDGSLFIADFYEHYIAHGQHYQSQIDHTTGRIYRLRGKGAKLEPTIDFATLSEERLIAKLSHSNKWHRQAAVRTIGRRDTDSIRKTLRSLIQKGKDQTALEALWALHQNGGLDKEILSIGLNHPYAPVRAWTARLVGDKKIVPGELVSEFINLAKTDSSAEVRQQLACTSRRLPAEQGLPIARALMLREEDAEDPYLPLLIWWAIQEQVESSPDAVLALLDQPDVWEAPIVFNDLLPRIMRRFAFSGKRADLLACAGLLDAAPSAKHSRQLLKGFNEAFRGRAMTGLPDELLSAMSRFGKAPLLMRLRQGEATAKDQALEIVNDDSGDETERLTMIRALGELGIEKAKPDLLRLGLTAPTTVRQVAIAALATFDDPDIARAIVEGLPSSPDSVRAAAMNLLAGRTASADVFLKAVETGAVSRTLVTAEMADLFRRHRDKGISQRAKSLFPVVTSGDADAVNRSIKRIEAALKGDLGNAYEGEKIYAARCAACHVLFFKGGKVGPDLTAYQRDNLGTMLISIVDPNAEIREGYEYRMILTKDGRSIGGFITESDSKVTVVRGLDGQDVTFQQEDIREIKPVGRSLMPDGLLDDLNVEQLRDLFAFLRSAQPITK